MILLQISDLAMWTINIVMFYLFYHFFKWLRSPNVKGGTTYKPKPIEHKSYHDCLKEARKVIAIAEKRAKDIKWWYVDIEETDDIAEGKEYEIQQLAKEIYKDYNGFEFRG
jgi:hypothetical protein